MGEQLEFKGLEGKESVFYVRCRPKVKQTLLLQMQKDGFSSMADWFEQFVTTTLGTKNDSKKRKLPRSHKVTKRTRS